MMYSRTLGEARISNILEYMGPTHAPEFVFPELDKARIAPELDWLAPHHYLPAMDRFVVAMQLWVLELRDHVVVIDTGVGNHKQRPGVPRMHMLNTLVPLWLEAAGATAERVTHVLCTHFHGDHVGWNTRLVDGAWVPSFPNARYVMPQADFTLAKAAFDAGDHQTLTGSFADSILPVHEAGLVDFIDTDTEIVPGLRAERMPGHTAGAYCYHLRSGGRDGMFSGDIMHSALQVAMPEVNTWIDYLPAQARASRRLFLTRAMEREALVMPAHFGYPHCGYVRATPDGGFRFEAEAR